MTVFLEILPTTKSSCRHKNTCKRCNESDLIQMPNAEGATPFIVAARHNNVAFMKTLMKSSAEVVVLSFESPQKNY